MQETSNLIPKGPAEKLKANILDHPVQNPSIHWTLPVPGNDDFQRQNREL